MTPNKTRAPRSLTQAAAVLGLALAGVAAMPAIADDAAPQQPVADKAAPVPQPGADAAGAESKAANPCAVKKKKKKKGPCAVGG